jgi:hypothetical protein
VIGVDRSALATEFQFELGRRRLGDFSKLTVPGFEDPPHIRYLAQLLERVENGTLKRLIVNVPPKVAGFAQRITNAAKPWHAGGTARQYDVAGSI